ncbi:hypothetical protein J7481_19515 [Labrenzia sp. R4_2]|uniref:hypothetical protein n=1 Tax=Labrenzia sp. R4_2 TaxID=2821107 RepID=UPI001ADAB3C2|nr:hypothetical protein [Labrenzia sp. R4_2]MBO9421705.1 hypothetical protein [Labrenzia sp. R4_2]
MNIHIAHAPMPRNRTPSFWLGVVTGILVMALADVTDLRLCAGECDGDGLSLLELLEQQPAKKTDRLPIEAGQAEHG